MDTQNIKTPIEMPQNSSVNNGAGVAGKETSAAPGMMPVSQKVMSVSANLVQLLPTGSVLAYQILAPSFSNQGKCYPSNWWITLGLVVVLTASVVFFAFTDSLAHNGKVYYGVAVKGRLNIFNISKEEEVQEFRDLKRPLNKRGLKKQDFVHATLSAVVFLTMAFSDVGLQNCFFPQASTNTQQLLKNLPLGMAVFSSLVFTIFPTKRNFIGSKDPIPDGDQQVSSSKGQNDVEKHLGPTPASELPLCSRCAGVDRN